MTIAEAIKAKETLERCIASNVEAFTDATGVTVERVCLTCYKDRSMGVTTVHYQVEVEAQL